MNYHFKPNNKKEELLQQLNQLDHGIKNDNNSLERLKLESEFYQDKGKPTTINRESLADQIMKELINDPYKPKNEPLKFELKAPQLSSQSPKDYSPHPVAQPLPQAQRQNNLINQRQIAKNKLQNQKHEGLFPSSSDHNRIRNYGKQPAQIIPQQDRNISPQNNNNEIQQANSKGRNSPKYNLNFDPTYNPFVKDDALEKQKKEERNRQYLKSLQEQRNEQQRQKKERIKEEKEIKVQTYNNYQPNSKGGVTQKPLIMKKADPNSKPPKIEPTMGNYSQFDKNLIKSKVIELRMRFKKGKIIYQEYERQLSNFRKQYPGDFQELLEEDNNANKKESSPAHDKMEFSKQEQEKPKIQLKQQEQQKNQHYNFPIRNQSINYSQFMPSMLREHPQANQSNIPINPMQFQSYPNILPPNVYGLVPPSYFQGSPPPEYMDLLKKMFDFCFKQVREVRNEQMTQNNVLQQTLNKFLINTQNNILTQQSPPIPHQMPRQFHSDVKQHREYFEKELHPRKKQIPSNESLSQIPFGESDNSEYYDKSLSAIANKIPFTHKVIPKEDEKLKQSVLDQFYGKNYKIKPLKKFNILIDPNQSQAEIPTTSSYLRAKNAKQQLKHIFQEDLNQLKRLQTDKGFKKFAGKMTGNASYSDRRIIKNSSNILVSSKPFPQDVSPISKQESFQGNPFLKKHISSNDENILTFNEKDLKINSPSGYSPASKKQILEQDEYQTESKIKEDLRGASSLIQQYEQRMAKSSKPLNLIKNNNQFLSKYDKTEQSKKEAITIKYQESKVSHSKDYFSNNQISPVKHQEHYQESLVTIRSDFQSKHSQHPQKKLLNLVSPTKVATYQEQQQENNEIRYSLTVESVEESSSKLCKPPIAKRRSIGKKKESSISRSKTPVESAFSQSSKRSEEDSFVPGGYPKLESSIYESQYEGSAELIKPRKIDPQLIFHKPLEIEQGYPHIQINPPTIITPKGEYPHIQSSFEEIKHTSKQVQVQGKWKSLQEARKLAKQGRIKAIDESKDFRSVEQKFQELQSFITKRGEQSQYMHKQAPLEIEKDRLKQKKSQSKKTDKKNIMKLLEQLQDGDEENTYKQEFDSYREESQHYH